MPRLRSGQSFVSRDGTDALTPRMYVTLVAIAGHSGRVGFYVSASALLEWPRSTSLKLMVDDPLIAQRGRY